MDWETISPVAELIEAIVIVISVVYVAIQMRQNTLAVKATAAQAQMDGYNSVISSLVQSKDAASAWYRGLQDATKLKPEESVQYFAHCNLYFKLIETSYFQHKSGALQPELWVGLANLNHTFMGLKGIHQFLERRGNCYSPEFQDWLQEQIESAKTKTAPYPGMKKSAKPKK